MANNRRKSLLLSPPNFNILNNSKEESNKDIKRANGLFNLPNIKDNNKMNNSQSNNSHKKDNKSYKNLNTIKSNKKINFKDSKKVISPINTDNKKDNDKDNIDKKNKNEEDNKVNKSTKNLLENDIDLIRNYQQININIKNQNTRNKNRKKEIYKNHKNINISDTANEILSKLHDKEEKLSKSTSKLNRSLIFFKKKDDFNTLKVNKTNFTFKYLNNSSKSSQISDNSNKRIGLMFKQVNENNSQFHFPLINKLFYKDKKGKIDMIDRIKFNLKQEYSEKIKEKKISKDKEMIGHEILNKLNNQYELEKLLEMADEIREKRRKEANYE